MTITSKKKKLNLLENCQIHALRLSCNAYTWQELDDLIFYGQWISSHDSSQNGPRPVTNAWIDWFQKFIILVNTNNIVMWEILLSNADWDCFRTLTSREILGTQNPLLEEHCAFLEVIHLFSGICTVILWQDCYGKGNLRKSCWNMAGRKFQIGNAYLYIVKKDYSYLCIVDDIKLAGKKQNLDPMWKLLNKKVDLGEPTSFLDHENLGCTQRKCERSKDIVDNYRTMFESRISAGGVEKLPFPQHIRISSWSYDMAGHAKKCVERYCELAHRTTEQLCKVSTPCIDDHRFKEEELKSVGESSQLCSQIVLTCLYLARIGRPDILWSVNKLARSITKWTKACDKQLSRLISHTHHTCDYKQCCHVENTAKQCRLELFRDSGFAGDFEDSKSTSGGTLCIFRKPYVRS